MLFDIVIMLVSILAIWILAIVMSRKHDKRLQTANKHIDRYMIKKYGKAIIYVSKLIEEKFHTAENLFDDSGVFYVNDEYDIDDIKNFTKKDKEKFSFITYSEESNTLDINRDFSEYLKRKGYVIEITHKTKDKKVLIIIHMDCE